MLKFKKGPRGQLPAVDETGVRDWEDGWSQEARHCPGLAPHVRWKGCQMQRRPKPEELLSKLNLQGHPASGHGGGGGGHRTPRLCPYGTQGRAQPGRRTKCGRE